MAEVDPTYDGIKSRLEAGGYEDENELLLDAIEVFCTETHRLNKLHPKTAFEIASYIIAHRLRYGETIEPGQQPYVRFPTQFQLTRVLDRIEIRDMEVRRFLLARVAKGERVGNALSAAERRFPISYKTAEGIWQEMGLDARDQAKRRGKLARESLKMNAKNSRKKG